ncbi:hypothetical protein JOD55_001615 [Arcanobacterium pluranimalium]|uniref:hypothetical protein n=1 Tax=Arcanobacterium pluranimalium TaxID=108028 RepID=UPI0019582EFA|nr:hypothetical protein [Arcanobacterium pluranimalium]MBM7825788.1 hypothetical protein [Arcanobacterium pluranimalium]
MTNEKLASARPEDEPERIRTFANRVEAYGREHLFPDFTLTPQERVYVYSFSFAYRRQGNHATTAAFWSLLLPQSMLCS